MKYEISIYSNAKSESVETVVEISNDEALRELLRLSQNPPTDFAKCEKLYDAVELALKEVEEATKLPFGDDKALLTIGDVYDFETKEPLLQW